MEHISICPIADGKHLYPYKCCCQIIRYTQNKIAEHMLNVCKHSVTKPCWKCRELAKDIILYRFEENSDAV